MAQQRIIQEEERKRRLMGQSEPHLDRSQDDIIIDTPEILVEELKNDEAFFSAELPAQPSILEQIEEAMLNKLDMVPEDSKESKGEQSPAHNAVKVAVEDTSPGGSVLYKKKKKNNARRTSIKKGGPQH